MSEDIRVPSGLTINGLLVRRYAAWCIDSFAVMLVFVLLMTLADALLFSARASLAFLALPGLLLVWTVYGSVSESSSWQATAGKRLVGLRVYRADGGSLPLHLAAGRNLIKTVPYIVLGLLPGGQLLSIFWAAAHVIVMHRSPVYQAIHDRAVHSFVAAAEDTTQLRLV